MRKLYFTDAKLGVFATVSSVATTKNFMDTLTVDTEGDPCGPADEYEDEYVEQIRQMFNAFEEMADNEANEWLAHLAAAWCLSIEELEYLR